MIWPLVASLHIPIGVVGSFGMARANACTVLWPVLMALAID